jgi:hypothetical protein
MARGKYAARADTRLQVLESSALRDAHAKIADLEEQLAKAKHKLDTAEAQMQGQAMKAAAGMSAREKRNLRDQISSLEYQAREDALRYAVLTWELMHRTTFERPSPAKIVGIGSDDFDYPEFPETPEQLKETYDYWCHVHWEVAALFLADFEQIRRFQKLTQGYEWRMAGDTIVRTTARENTRTLYKGRIRDAMMKRVMAMRDYYERIWKARLAGNVEPMSQFREILDHVDDAPVDRRDNLLKKMRARR